MTTLEYNLSSKHPLRFNDSGKLKILQLSDIQESLDYNPETLSALDRLVDREVPELVVLCGDNCNGHSIKSCDELRRYLEIFTSPMEKRHIPWAHVFGNHDHDMCIDGVEQALIYESFDYCISKHTDGIGGTTNFVIPIMSSDMSRIAYNVWGLDTGNTVRNSDISHVAGIFDFPKRTSNSQGWDFLRFDQLTWYWNSSLELEKHNGGRISGIVFMHIALPEFQLVVDNPEVAGTVGSTAEYMSLGALNSGAFAAFLQRGDIRAISCGHSHEDCFKGEICGISVSLDACAGYSPYGIDELRGGRVFILDENDPDRIETYMSHYSEL